jgi:hypothetical protein
VIRFTVYFNLNNEPDERKSILVEMVNQLTRETATRVLHIFHHFGSSTYLRYINTLLYVEFDGPDDFREFIITGPHFNAAIFTALRHARGGKRLELFVNHYPRNRTRQYLDLFEAAEATGDGPIIHFRYPRFLR